MGLMDESQVPWIIGEMLSETGPQDRCRNQNILGMQAILFDRLRAQASTPEEGLAAEE